MAEQIYGQEDAAPLHLSDIISQPIANKLLDIAVNCGVGVAAKIAQPGCIALGHLLVVDGKIREDAC